MVIATIYLISVLFSLIKVQIKLKVENASALNSDFWRSGKSTFELFCLWNHSWQSNCIHRWAIYIIVLHNTHLPDTYLPTHPPTYNPGQKCCTSPIQTWKSFSPSLPLLFPHLPSPSPFQCCIYFMRTTLYCMGRGTRDFLMSQLRTLVQNFT